MNTNHKPPLPLLVALLLLGLPASTFASPLADTSPRIWTLPVAVAYALENNPDAGIARERLTAAQAEFERARSAYSPVLSVGTGYSAGDTPGQAFGWILNQRAFEPGIDFNRPGTIDNWNAHAIMSWPLYDGGRRAGSVSAARAGTDALRANQEAVRNDIAFGVTRAFFEIARADAVMEALDAQLKTLEEAIKVADAQVEQGGLLEAEALHIRVDRARTREDFLRARHAAALTRRTFVNLLGLPYDNQVIDLKNVMEVLPPPRDVTSGRPELDAARMDRQAARDGIQIAEAARRPQVEVFGRVDHDEGWRTNGSGQSWSAGIALRYDIWDGGNAASQTKSARARLRESAERERKVQLAIEHETQQARLAFEEVQLRIDVARDAVQLAGENSRLARARFDAGALLSTQLTEAESNLRDARVRLSVAETDLAVTTAALRRALGFFPIDFEP